MGVSGRRRVSGPIPETGTTPRVVRAALLAGWAGVVLCTLLSVVRPLPPVLRYLPLVASILLFGLPHGAVDHVTVPWARGESPTRRWYALVGAVYAILGGGYLALWLVAPAAAFVVFVLLTWAHWGQGDVYSLVRFLPATHLRSWRQRVRVAAIRGALPMVVPLVAFPERYRSVAVTLVGLFDPGATALLAPAFTLPVRALAGGGLAALTVAHLAATRRGLAAERCRAWRVDAGESVLLWTLFLLVPPVLAVGAYFCLWHSVRHVARVATVDPRRESGGAALAGTCLRLGRTAALPTLGALAVLVAVAALVPNPPDDLSSAVGLYLVVVAVLTLPHVVFAAWMDRVESVWSG